jgi:hypothetical protein
MAAVKGLQPTYYRDAAVVAYRVPKAEAAPAAKATITASGAIDTAVLGDGDLTRQVELPFAPDKETWVQFDYGRPQTLARPAVGGGACRRVRRVRGHRSGGPHRGQRRRQDLPAPDRPAGARRAAADRGLRRDHGPLLPGGLPAAQARPGLGMFGGPAPTSHKISELAFEVGARVHRFEDKAGWSAGHGAGRRKPRLKPRRRRDPLSDVIDLTDRLKPDGGLDWTPPAGNWVVLRYGYSLTGRQNSPASDEGTGLEVDKLSGEAREGLCRRLSG